MRNIVFFSSIKWDYAWHRQQELMKKMADSGNRVLFVQPCSQKKGVELKKVSKNVWVITTRGLPYERCLYTVNIINGIRSRNDIQACMDKLKFYNPIIWFDRVHGVDCKYFCSNYDTIYDLVDEIIAFGRVRNDRMLISIENYVLRNVKLVTSSSRTLLNRKLAQSGRAKESVFIPNGVDFVRFNTEQRWEKCSQFEGPIIGFVGTISKRSLNFSLVLKAANVYKNCHFVFVGPGKIEDKELLNGTNIHVFDAVDGTSIPKVINAFDVAIIPYVNNGYAMDYVFPRKACEYLCSGKPVVSTDMKEVRYLKPYVFVANNDDEFIEYIRIALEDFSISVGERKHFAQLFDWDNILQQLIEKIDSWVND